MPVLWHGANSRWWIYQDKTAHFCNITITSSFLSFNSPLHIEINSYLSLSFITETMVLVQLQITNFLLTHKQGNIIGAILNFLIKGEGGHWFDLAPAVNVHLLRCCFFIFFIVHLMISLNMLKLQILYIPTYLVNFLGSHASSTYCKFWSYAFGSKGLKHFSDVKTNCPWDSCWFYLRFPFRNYDSLVLAIYNLSCLPGIRDFMECASNL